MVREKSQRMILYLSDFIYMHIQTLQGKGSESQATEAREEGEGIKREREKREGGLKEWNQRRVKNINLRDCVTNRMKMILVADRNGERKK